MTFKQLGLSEKMLLGLREIGYKTPSEIQQKVIPIALSGKDVIGQAQTGTGKTAAFAIPMIEKVYSGKGIQALVLAPSRELATQIFNETRKLAVEQQINIVEVIGGISYDIQRKQLNRNPNIIIATPGRLMDHIRTGRIKIDLSNVSMFVLDEADEMLNFGFRDEIIKFSKMLPKDHQTLLLTATFNKKTLALGKDLLNNPATIEVSSGMSSSKTIEQRYIKLKEKSKLNTLVNLLRIIEPEGAIIFGRTKRRADELAKALKELGFKAKAIHGDMRQRERSHAIEKFRKGDLNILIGTDVIARGIDIDKVDVVFNFDLPREIEYYTHRIGRTGRAKSKGLAISFVKESEQGFFNEIMRKTNSKAILSLPPSEKDIADFKVKQLTSELNEYRNKGKSKFSSLATKIGQDYSQRDLELIVAGFFMTKHKNVYDINLTPETNASGKQKSLNRNRRRRGNNRNHNTNSGKNKKTYNTSNNRSNKNKRK